MERITYNDSNFHNEPNNAISLFKVLDIDSQMKVALRTILEGLTIVISQYIICLMVNNDIHFFQCLLFPDAHLALLVICNFMSTFRFLMGEPAIYLAVSQIYYCTLIH